MSGLLDKAKSDYSDSVHQGDNIQTQTVNDPDAIIAAYEKGKSASEGLLAKSKPNDSEKPKSSGGDKNSKKKVSTTKKPETKKSGENSASTGQLGIGLGLVMMCVVLYMVWDLKNWEGIIPFGILILAWGCTAWGFKEIKGDWNKNRTIAIGLSFLVVAAIPYFAAFSWQGGNVRASEYEIDEVNDNLLFTLYNTVGDQASVSIEVGGDEVWSAGAIEYSSKGYSEVSVPLSDLYQGSTLDHNGNNVLVYKITVSSGSVVWDGEIDAEVLERTITAAGVDMKPVTEQEDESGDGSGHTDTTHLGLQVGIGLGVEKNNLNRAENGEGQWDAYIKQLSSDYSFTFVISYEGSNVWDTSTTFTVDGDSMTSSSGDTGTLAAGWMDLVMSNNMDSTKDELGRDVHYIPRDDFWQGDGCYKATLTITHEISTGDSFDTFSKTNYWEENENKNAGEEYKPAVAC